MGVRGLTSYIESIGNLGKQIELLDTKLIIDGDNLCNYLYRENGFDCRCGGQYQEFYSKVGSFFDGLESQRVESFVVLDGAYDKSDKKLETKKKRAQDRIETSKRLFKNERSPDANSRPDFLLPLLAKLVFVQALRDRSIKFAVSDCEADTDIASLASEWKCPVLSNDSDFFIFDIKGGYIPLFSLSSDNLTARIFYRSELARHFGIRGQLIPLFASLLGNDYLSWDVLKPFNRAVWILYSDGRRGKEARFLRVASMLSQLYDSITEKQAFQFALDLVEPGESREELKQAVEYSLQEYTVLKSNLLYYFQEGMVRSFLRTQSNLEIEEEVLRRFREGKFSTNCMSSLTAGKVFLKVQVEDPEKRSANQCSKSLRQFVYGILNNGGRNIKKIEEWDRDGPTVKYTDITPYNDGVPWLSCILNVDLNNRLTVLLDALDSNTANIKSLPEEFKLIAASLRFVVSNAQPPLETNHLAALLCSCVKLADGSWKQDLENPRRSLSQTFGEQAAQSFCQWQCVLRDAIHLNFVLFEPVQTPCIHKTFNGQLVHCLQEELSQGRKPESLMLSAGSLSRYKDLYTVITDQEENDDIAARMQNLQLHEPSMNHSKNPTTSNTPQSRPPLPQGGVSPPKRATPTAPNYVSRSTSLSSRTASAASYNPMVYRRRETKPPNVTAAHPTLFYAENSAARHHSSPPNRFLSSTRSMEEAQQLLRPPRGVSSQRGGSKSRVCVVCQRTPIEIGQKLCDTCEYYRKY